MKSSLIFLVVLCGLAVVNTEEHPSSGSNEQNSTLEAMTSEQRILNNLKDIAGPIAKNITARIVGVAVHAVVDEVGLQWKNMMKRLNNAVATSTTAKSDDKSVKAAPNMVRLGPIMDEVIKFMVKAAFHAAYGILSKETLDFAIQMLKTFGEQGEIMMHSR
ncbi:hypothetical protein QAD02_011881 [Eretmocerus hayati]|uniref:Uncharacterized protein n=1 Tax=Eretmocerus hayati TaxID=131215 RepID=A0ACC2P2U1_9HYME|nr:hypothetical protein QAD02_011881 [Eretmocerus hayati]